MCRLGFPSQLHSDQGRQFESEIFKQMCSLLGIRKIRTTPSHSKSDGQTERMNRALIEPVRARVDHSNALNVKKWSTLALIGSIDLLAKSAAEDPANWDIKVPHVMAA